MTIKRTKSKILKKRSKIESRSIDYHEELIKRLKNPEYAVVYLNTAIEESLKGDTESKKLLLRALKHVVEAQGNISNLAKRSELRRESIYRMLSETGNPHLQSFTALIRAMGFGIQLYDLKQHNHLDNATTAKRY